MRQRLDCTIIGDAMIDVALPLSDIEDIYCLSQGGVINTEICSNPSLVCQYQCNLGSVSI